MIKVTLALVVVAHTLFTAADFTIRAIYNTHTLHTFNKHSQIHKACKCMYECKV